MIKGSGFRYYFSVFSDIVLQWPVVRSESSSNSIKQSEGVPPCWVPTVYAPITGAGNPYGKLLKSNDVKFKPS